MSAGYRASVPGDITWLLEELNRMRERISQLERTRGATIVGVTSNSVILQDANGIYWKLGVSTSGATTWTQT